METQQIILCDIILSWKINFDMRNIFFSIDMIIHVLNFLQKIFYTFTHTHTFIYIYLIICIHISLIIHNDFIIDIIKKSRESMENIFLSRTFI